MYCVSLNHTEPNLILDSNVIETSMKLKILEMKCYKDISAKRQEFLLVHVGFMGSQHQGVENVPPEE